MGEIKNTLCLDPVALANLFSSGIGGAKTPSNTVLLRRPLEPGQFTSYEYQQFLKDHHITLSMSDVGHCGDNAPAEGFLGMLKRERVNRRRYLTVADARSDVFDYIERFHNPRIQRRLDSLDRELEVGSIGV